MDPQLAQAVFERDLRTGFESSGSRLSFAAWKEANRHGACVAPQLNPALSGTCSGRLTLDHVHRRGETAMRMKADDSLRTLQTACEGHHGTNRYGGGWLTSREARELARTRLELLYPA